MKPFTVTEKFAKIQKLPDESFYLTLLPYEIECGRHSGFPDCCVKFFVTRWITLDADTKFRKNYFKRIQKVLAGYIPCPKCLRTNNFVEVLACPKSCRKKILLYGKEWWKVLAASSGRKIYR